MWRPKSTAHEILPEFGTVPFSGSTPTIKRKPAKPGHAPGWHAAVWTAISLLHVVWVPETASRRCASRLPARGGLSSGPTLNDLRLGLAYGIKGNRQRDRHKSNAM